MMNIRKEVSPHQLMLENRQIIVCPPPMCMCVCTCVIDSSYCSFTTSVWMDS